jgi:hypothetical protein
MNLSMAPRRMLIYATIGAACVVFGIFGQSSDDTSAAVTHHAGEGSRGRQGSSTLSPKAAAFLTRLAHRTTESKTADALFASRSWYVPPPPPPPVAAPPPPPPEAPTAPPLPFTFIGSYAADGDRSTYFLARGDRIYDVKEGDSIDSEYVLVAADAGNLIFNYKPLNARQSLALGGAQ